jgi:Ni,Fe-hydrogenase III small subunit
MSQWVTKGLGTEVPTTRYPAHDETAAGVSPGLPTSGPGDEALAGRCPTGALAAVDGRIVVDRRRCIHCSRCRWGAATPLTWQDGYEWAGAAPGHDRPEPLDAAFARSAHVLVVDAGDCGACLSEVQRLNNPYYNMHRLGLFITPTPRHADILLVVGSGADHMRAALAKAYQAMPSPKRVVAVGACALMGGVFAPSFVTEGGVAGVVPVDVEVPGQPPPPLAILHGLLVALGRRPPARWSSEEVAR